MTTQFCAPKHKKAVRIPCLPERGFAHHRDMETVGPGREVGRCRFCGDARFFETAPFPSYALSDLYNESQYRRPMPEAWAS